MFFLMTVSSAPLGLVHGKQASKHVAEIMYHPGLSQALFQNKTFLSELVEADPETLNTILGHLNELLAVSQAASLAFTTDVSAALSAKDVAQGALTEATSEFAQSDTTKIAADLALDVAQGALTEATSEFNVASSYHTAMVDELNDKQPGVDAETEPLRSSRTLIETLIPAGARDAAIPFTSSTDINVSVPGQLLATSGAWAVGTYSSESMPDSAIGFQFKVTDDVSHIMFGLSHGNTNVGWPDVDYGICLRGQWAGPLRIDVFVRGSHRGSFGNYVAGDVFTQIVGADNKVKFYRNAELFYTESSAPTLPLLVDASFYAPSSLTDIVWIYSWP